VIRRLWDSRNGWLWLSLASFSTLVLLVVYELRLVAPEVDRYFSQADNITGHQLATRSRVFVHDALDAMVRDVSSPQAAAMSLEMAYSFLDIVTYRELYDCTPEALADLDTWRQRLLETPPPSAEQMTRGLLPVLQCQTEIETGQRIRGSETVTQFVAEARSHQSLLLGGILVIYLLGLLFWRFHEKQRLATQEASRESLRWMAKALQDPLTGVGNRNALHARIDEQSDLPLGLLLVDIDYFKPYNDSLGHPEGDRLLRQLVGLIEMAMEGDSRLYRMGGDEFAVLLPCASSTALEARCERLVQVLRQQAMPHPASPVAESVTLSVGGVWFSPAQASFDTAYAAADAALYHVKQRGRDGCKVGSRELMPHSAGAI